MSATSEIEAVPRTALTLREAAHSAGVSLTTFRKHVLPTIKAVRLGSTVVVSRPELEKWLEDRGTLNTAYN